MEFRGVINPIFDFQIAFQVSRYWSAVKVLKNNHHFILRQNLRVVLIYFNGVIF